ncbi:dystrotelin [Pungitius pungitius]|uniref:dystrotelin n=1 Tax=Pungitius pungitius TaxID=134920 RepID=UPI002E160619
MDLHIIEGLNEIRPSVYRVAMKLLSLQRLRHMDQVFFRHITAALPSVGRVDLQQENGLNRQEVTQILKRMFHGMSQEVTSHVTEEAPEEICSLMFRLNDRSQSGCISTVSLQTFLIALSAERLLVKYRALVRVSGNGSGSVSRSGLRSLLQDLNQVPGAVQEEGVFTDVEAAVTSCFHKVSTPTANEEHVVSWLQSEPPLLLWLPTLYRLSVSQNVSHAVRCHTCKTRPFSGLRYRCMKCVNVHLCQSCFWTGRHKTHHPVLEFCTQPTWRESLSSLVSSARHALSPRRYTQGQALSGRGLIRVEPGEALDRARPASRASTRLTPSAVSHTCSFDQDGAIDQPPSCSSKALQTHSDTPPQQLKASVLLKEVRNLQRDKWLMEQQLQVLRLNVQSEHGILEDRCSGMEVTMETLKEHNLRLQHSLMQALKKMDVQQDANDEHQNVDTEDTKDREVMDTEDTKDREQIWDRKDTDDIKDTIGHCWSEEELQPPTMHQYTPVSQDIYYEEDPAGDWLFCPTGQQGGAQEEVPCLSEGEGCGKCSPEELLQETAERLKTVMETDRLRYRHTGERKGAELLVAADQVCDSIRRLVDAVRADAY